MAALLDVSHLPAELMPYATDVGCITLTDVLFSYLSLYKKSFFDLGVKRADGTELTPEEVTNQLNE